MTLMTGQPGFEPRAHTVNGDVIKYAMSNRPACDRTGKTTYGNIIPYITPVL